MNASIAKTLLASRTAISLKDYKKSDIKTDKNNDSIFAMLVDIAKLGYTFSPALIDNLKLLSTTNLNSFFKDTRTLLKGVVGDDVKHAPLFRKFPESTPDRSFVIEEILTPYSRYFYMLHYVIYYTWNSDEYNGTWFGRQFKGQTVEDVLLRPELVCDKELIVLNLATDEDINAIFTNLIAAKGSISEDNKSFVKDMVVNLSTNLAQHLPTEIPNKENLAYLIACVYERYGFAPEIRDMFLPFMKTATDIIRVATGLSGGDVSLAEHKTKFKLSNSQRKFVMQALDNLNYHSATEDMLRFHGLWLVLAKYLHVNAYADKFPQATAMVQAIRNNPSDIETFNGTVEEFLAQPSLDKSLAKFLKVIEQRPGDYARRLDHILRLTERKDRVVKSFLSVADKVATPLLLNLSTHFAHRNAPAKVRVYCPKGSTTNAIVERGETRPLFATVTTKNLATGINDILINRYATKESLGKVYIDPSLADVLVPTSMRDASSSLKVAARGSKFKIPDDAKVVRLFIYWENIKDADTGYDNRVDIDLSCQMMGEDFSTQGVVSYYRLKGTGITHSGDFTSAPNGASEFIDIDINKVLKEKNVRYIAMTVNSFTGQRFNGMVAKGGYMVRDGKTGKTFEAKTVEQKYDITAGTKFAVPLIFDLVERKIIWMDLGFHDANRCSTNIGDKGADLQTLAQYAVEMYREKASLFDLLKLHADGRATSISTVFDKNEKYDNVFDAAFSNKIDEIMAEYI